MIEAAQLARIPTEPGVYLFRDAGGTILYIGKAKSLRTRVRSYFRGGRNVGLKVQEIARRAETVDTIVVSSEAEALILESNLIKEHRPRFNVQLKDDRRYPYIRVTVQEPFPRVLVTRRVRKDGSRYFGPYPSVRPMRRAIEVIKRLYTVRSCTYDLPREAPPRPCLDYHIGRCKAPCVDLQSESDYREMIGEILRILDGGIEEVRQEISVRMRTAAAQLRFEEAARLRDSIEGLASLAVEQQVERLAGGDKDVIGVARDGLLATGILLRIRKGILVGREALRFRGLTEGGTEEELVRAILIERYLSGGELVRQEMPPEILLPSAPEEMELLESVLREGVRRSVELVVPERGEKRRLIELARTNARHHLEELVPRRSGAGAAEEVLFELQARLGLKVVPRLILCFDISHLQGGEVVASSVAFENGAPRKSTYRHMKIRGTWGNDDVRSMAEAVRRVVARRLEEGTPLPELILIDGGRTQLAAAERSLHELGATEVALAALAKKEEELFLPGRSESLRLSRRDPALRLLQRIRDEAHRFALAYHRSLRRRTVLKSALSNIPGVGPARERLLLRHFGSVRGLREATEEELASVPGIPISLAKEIRSILASQGEGSGEDSETDAPR